MDTAASHQDTDMKTLDLRPLAHPERHEQIFSNLDNLQKGQSMRIINDHDPKPLYLMLQAEHPGEFVFEYEQNGPKDWIVKINKVM